MGLQVKWEYTSKENSEFLSSQNIDLFTVEVWGDRNNASYEWIIKNSDGQVKAFSNDGYGQTGVAMLEGLWRVRQWVNAEISDLHIP